MPVWKGGWVGRRVEDMGCFGQRGGSDGDFRQVALCSKIPSVSREQESRMETVSHLHKPGAPSEKGYMKITPPRHHNQVLGM